MTVISLVKGKAFIAKNEGNNKILIFENLGKSSCNIRSNKSNEDFKGYKLGQYSYKEFSVDADEKFEIISNEDTNIRITGTDY